MITWSSTEAELALGIIFGLRIYEAQGYTTDTNIPAQDNKSTIFLAKNGRQSPGLIILSGTTTITLYQVFKNTMSITNEKDEDNILTQITFLCKAVRESVSFLSSTILPKNNCPTKEDKDQIISKIEEWISKSVKVIESATENFRKDENLLPPKKFQWSGSVSLFPIRNEPGSILVQMILWSCVSQSCYNAITKSLNDAREGNNALPQKTTRASKRMLWTWLQSYAFCIKTSVHYSCKHIVQTVKEDPREWTPLKNHISNYILLETCFVNGTILRSAEVFTMIGTNAKPSDYFTRFKSSERPQDTSSRMQSQDMAVEATKNFLRYLKRMPKVGFVNPPEGTINVGYFTNQPHLFGDILTYMQENVKMKKYFKTGKGTKGQSSSKLAKLQREKYKQDGKTKVPRKHFANALDQIKPQLEKLWISVKINIKFTHIKIQRATDKIAKTNLTKQERKSLGKWAGSQIAVLSTCVSTLLRAKSTNLSFGEKILIFIFSDALNACNAQDGKLCPRLGVLLKNLSETLFQNCNFVTGIITKKYKVPIDDVAFWETHFTDECKRLTSSGGKDVSMAQKEKLSKGESSIQEKKKKEKGPLSVNKGNTNNRMKRARVGDQMRMTKSRKLQEDTDLTAWC